MKSRKLIHDSFYVNNESFSGVTINDLDEDLYYYYNKNNDDWKLSILDENGDVIQVSGITTPTLLTPTTTTTTLAPTTTTTTTFIIPPSGLTTSGTTDYIQLDWINSINDLQTYVERSNDSGVTYSGITITNTGISYYQDYDVIEDINYYYRVKSYKEGNFSDYSNVQQGALSNVPENRLTDPETEQYFIDPETGETIVDPGDED